MARRTSSRSADSAERSAYSAASAIAPRALRFARYMATSAAAIRLAGVSPTPARATPTDAEIDAMPSRSASGAEIASTMRAATERADVGVAEPGTEHDELVATEPAGPIGRPQHAIDPLGHDHERLVAGGVTEACR